MSVETTRHGSLILLGKVEDITASSATSAASALHPHPEKPSKIFAALQAACVATNIDVDILKICYNIG